MRSRPKARPHSELPTCTGALWAGLLSFFSHAPVELLERLAEPADSHLLQPLIAQINEVHEPSKTLVTARPSGRSRSDRAGFVGFRRRDLRCRIGAVLVRVGPHVLSAVRQDHGWFAVRCSQTRRCGRESVAVRSEPTPAGSGIRVSRRALLCSQRDRRRSRRRSARGCRSAWSGAVPGSRSSRLTRREC